MNAMTIEEFLIGKEVVIRFENYFTSENMILNVTVTVNDYNYDLNTYICGAIIRISNETMIKSIITLRENKDLYDIMRKRFPEELI